MYITLNWQFDVEPHSCRKTRIDFRTRTVRLEFWSLALRQTQETIRTDAPN
jgi:hypothetical protein